MKIYDIISEATPAAPAPAPAVANPKVTRAVRNIKVMISRKMSVQKLYGEKVTSFIPKNAIRFVVVIKWLGMLPFFYEYWQQMTAISSLVAEKQMSDSDGAAAQRIVIEELIVKIVASAGFAGMIRWILRLRYIKYVTLAAGAVGSAATLGILGGPTVVAVLASEAAALWLVDFLKSEQGKEIIAYCVIYAIDPTVTWIWNKGPGAWVEALKAPELSAKGAEQTVALSTANGGKDNKVAAAGAASSQAANPAIDATSTEKDITGDTKSNSVQPNGKPWGVGNAYAPRINKTKAINYDEKALRSW